MNKRNILILFIISFISVVFTINNLCYEYFDSYLANFIVSLNILNISNSLSFEGNVILTKIMTECESLVLLLLISFLFLLFCVYSKKTYSFVISIIFAMLSMILYIRHLENGYVMNIVAVLCSIVTSLYFSFVYKKVFKDDISKKIETVLSKYISKDIKNKILKNSSYIDLGGKRADISVMFADIRGFTSLSETRKAEEVSSLLNEYFSELEPIISKYNGVINKFIGDAVLVVFGDPEPDKHHAKNAVLCAYELRDKVKDIRQRWLEEGKPKIDIGIGINSGEAFIGNVGTKNRFEYTVIGDTVNIASRIEDYNKIYKTNILISESTYNKIAHFVDAIKIREVGIKGKRHKIDIYEVLRITE